MLATSWASGRGVLSHDTALDLHELCDINPAKVHLTLPPDYSPRRLGGDWGADFPTYANEVEPALGLDQAVTELNSWIAHIESSFGAAV